MFKREYDLFIATRAIQNIELNPTDENILYNSIEEVGETEEVFIYDMSNQHLVTTLKWDPYDDHEMYKKIKETIEEYEATL